MPTPQKPTPEELRNRRNIAKAQKAIREEYNHSIDEIFKSAVNIKFTADTFRLSDNPALQRKVNEVMKRFRLRVETTLVNAIQTSFLISQENFRNTVYGAYDGRAINEQIKAILNATYDRPMQAFLNRSTQGMKLSDRVWNLSTQFQREIEETIFSGLSNGRSASEMARDMKRYLNDPDRLFRRVRNAKGKLVLSKPAREFKPGQGVYRSSRKNAMRLSRTEINMAYRTADHNQYANTKFVLGIEVRLSDMHFVVDYCDVLAGFYPKDFKFVGWHPNCYDEDTEVYTSRGWLYFRDVLNSDKILSLNPETRDLEWSSITVYLKKHYQGQMIRYHNKALDMMVTPEHRMIYLNKHRGELKDKQAKDYSMGNGGLYRSSEWSGKGIDYIEVGDETISFDVFCEFMGYYLSDGSVSQTRSGEIFIAQSIDNDVENRAKIKTCLEKLPFKFWETKLGFGINHILFRDYLFDFGKCNEKYIPESIKGATPRQIQIFLDAFISCDGSIRKPKSFVGNRGSVFTSTKDSRTYFTTSKRMADDIGELILKIGRRPSFKLEQTKGKQQKFKNGAYTINHNLWRIAECYSQTATVFKKDYVDYDGYVYDVELEKNHILYVRRNGKCVWGSNCLCYQVPILPSKAEFDAYQEAMLRGEDDNFKFTGVIKDIPRSAVQWFENNKERIKGWKSTPYFIRDNRKVFSLE